MRSIHPCERFILYRYSWKEIISFIFLNMANCGQSWIHHFFSFFTLLGMEHPENTFPHSAGLYRSWIWLNKYCYLLLLLNKSYTCYYTGNNICYNTCVCYLYYLRINVWAFLVAQKVELRFLLEFSSERVLSQNYKNTG